MEVPPLQKRENKEENEIVKFYFIKGADERRRGII